jgi:flagellar motor component MotA
MDTSWRFVFAMGLGSGGIVGAIIGAVTLLTEPFLRRPRLFTLAVTLLGTILGAVPGFWFRNPEMGDMSWRQVFAIGMSSGAIVGAIAGCVPQIIEAIWRTRGPQ